MSVPVSSMELSKGASGIKGLPSVHPSTGSPWLQSKVAPNMPLQNIDCMMPAAKMLFVDDAIHKQCPDGMSLIVEAAAVA